MAHTSFKNYREPRWLSSEIFQWYSYNSIFNGKRVQLETHSEFLKTSEISAKPNFLKKKKNYPNSN